MQPDPVFGRWCCGRLVAVACRVVRAVSAGEDRRGPVARAVHLDGCIGGADRDDGTGGEPHRLLVRPPGPHCRPGRGCRQAEETGLVPGLKVAGELDGQGTHRPAEGKQVRAAWDGHEGTVRAGVLTSLVYAGRGAGQHDDGCSRSHERARPQQPQEQAEDGFHALGRRHMRHRLAASLALVLDIRLASEKPVAFAAAELDHRSIPWRRGGSGPGVLDVPGQDLFQPPTEGRVRAERVVVCISGRPGAIARPCRAGLVLECFPGCERGVLPEFYVLPFGPEFGEGIGRAAR